MNFREEQQADDSKRPPVDPYLVNEVLNQTQVVNQHLWTIINRTDTVIRRQNLLLLVFILLFGLATTHLILGFSIQQLQQSVKAQLSAVDLGRGELLAAVKEAKTEVQGMRASMKVVSTQLQGVPTVTADNQGRINLELPLDTKSQQTVAEQPQVKGDSRAPDKLVIPLRPKQSTLKD